MSLGNVYLTERDAAQAEAHYRSGLQLALQADALPVAVDALAGYAELRMLAGDRDGAVELARHVASHPAGSGNARARAAAVLRQLGGDSDQAAPDAVSGAFEELVRGILAAPVYEVSAATVVQ